MTRTLPAIKVIVSCTLGSSLVLGETPPEPPREIANDKSFVNQLGELVVVATRTPRPWIDIAGTTLSVDAEEQLRMGSYDLGGFARYDPTVSLPFDISSGDGAFAYGQSGYGSINIRGAEGNRIALKLDGIRQPPQYVSTSFDQGSGDGAGGIGRDYFDPAMFDLVEVLKGGASALYGSDALGGVVSLSTPEPESVLKGRNLGGLVRGQYFSVNGGVAGQIGGAVKQGDTSVFALYAAREGQETANNGREKPNPAEFTSHSGLVKIQHLFGDHRFRMALEVFKRETFTDVQSAVVSPFPVFTDYVCNDQFLERQRASIKWQWTPQTAWLQQLDSHVYWQHAGSLSESDAASKPIKIGGISIPGTERTRTQQIQFDTTIYGLSTTARRDFGDEESISHSIISGLDLSQELSENQFNRQDSGAPSDRERTSFAPTETTRGGLLVQDEIKIKKKWYVTPGLRLDWQTVEPDPNPEYLKRLATLGSAIQQAPSDYENLALAPRLNLA